MTFKDFNENYTYIANDSIVQIDMKDGTHREFSIIEDEAKRALNGINKNKEIIINVDNAY